MRNKTRYYTKLEDGSFMEIPPKPGKVLRLAPEGCIEKKWLLKELYDLNYRGEIDGLFIRKIQVLIDKYEREQNES